MGDQSNVSRRQVLRGAAATVITGALGQSVMAAAQATPNTNPTSVTAATQSSSSADRLKLSPLGYGNVKLTGGPLKEQYDHALNFFLALDNDKMLKVYRQKAGMPAPGPGLADWYSAEGYAPGHSLGQWMSALARFAAAGSAEAKTKLGDFIDAFAATLGQGVPFYDSRFPAYIYDKHVIGLVDAFRYAGIDRAQEILVRVTDIATPYLPEKALTWEDLRARPHKDNSYTFDESYTIAENLFIAHDIFGDQRYLEMAKRYLLDKQYFDGLAIGEPTMVGQHAYSHVNALGSAAMAYISLGSEKHLAAIRNAWEMLVKDQQYASGGWGPQERFVEPGKGQLFASLTTTHNHFETPCGSYAMFKLARYLTQITADGRYGDGLERVLYNGMLAAKRILPDGSTFYYSDYAPNTHKGYHPRKWPCCAGTYPQAIVDYLVSAYFEDGEGLYVNLYVPSVASWPRADGMVTVTQQTDYPESGQVKIQVEPAAEAEFAIHLRVPAWAGTANVSVNGQPIPETVAKSVDGYVSVRRRWKSGDAVELTLPMEFRMEAIDGQNPNVLAMMRGPVMYVAATDAPKLYLADPSSPSASVRSRFIPFYKIQDECYTTYLERTS